MRTLVIMAVIAVLGMATAFSQEVNNNSNVIRNGNTFEVVKQSIQQPKDTLVTEYTFKDSKGTEYPIVINRNSGRCYIWKTSSKTGKVYKSYMKEEIAVQICRELNIAYKED
jgi:hypothetical protein